MKLPARQPVRGRNHRVLNKRHRRSQHLLDVKVRSHRAASQRNRRILVITSKIILAVSTVAGLVYGIRYAARQLFFENPDYQLSRIEVQTDGTLQREQILRTADLREGVNIFSVNLGRVQEQLQALPQVEKVQVARNMPSEIAIGIVERKPVAWITAEAEMGAPFTSEGAFLVDARGMLMREKKLLPEYLGLPVIVGCANESLQAGNVVSSFEAKAALELLRLSTRSFMQTRFQIRKIDVSKGYCLVVTDKNRSRVTFGFDNLEQQLQRLEQFLVYSDDSRQEIETLNLLVQRNIPVTFTKTAAEVINETIDPDGKEPRILRAEPVSPAANAQPSPSASKPKKALPASPPRRAVPVQSGRKKQEHGT